MVLNIKIKQKIYDSLDIQNGCFAELISLAYVCESFHDAQSSSVDIWKTVDGINWIEESLEG